MPVGPYVAKSSGPMPGLWSVAYGRIPLVNVGAVVKNRLLPVTPNGGLRPRLPLDRKFKVAPGFRMRLAPSRLTVLPAPVPVVDVMVEWPLFSVMVPNVSVEAALNVL